VFYNRYSAGLLSHQTYQARLFGRRVESAEEHARLFWERGAVLVRPGNYVAWRAKLGSTEKAFTGAVGNADQEKVGKLAALQK